jgi:hypothetical protein
MRATKSEHAVLNTTAEEIPAFSAIELFGGFDANGTRKARKVTANDSLDVLFNGVMPIPAGAVGVGYEPWGSVTIGYDVNDLVPPSPGDIRGTAAGQWLLQPGRSGFRISGDPFNGGVTAEPQVSPRIAPTTTTTTTAAPTTTTTTTTLAPCTGKCLHTFNFSTKTWVKTSSTCGAGCFCLSPTFCPPTGLASACVTTDCGRLANDAPLPDCGGTTTTAAPGSPCNPTITTTTFAPDTKCGDPCVWYCHPTRSWIKINDGCSSSCPCDTPTTPCTPLSYCDKAVTSCKQIVIPPPPKRCNGNCLWVWVVVGAEPGYWDKYVDRCKGTNVPNCYCDAPSFDGTVCAQETATVCYVHTASGTAGPGDPGCGYPTTTTNTPGNCNGNCLWGSTNGTAWNNILRSCPGCACIVPSGTPATGCDLVETPCYIQPPTTPPPGTTTTTANPCLPCVWTCRRTGTEQTEVVLVRSCLGGYVCRTCAQPTVVLPCVEGAIYETPCTPDLGNICPGACSYMCRGDGSGYDLTNSTCLPLGNGIFCSCNSPPSGTCSPGAGISTGCFPYTPGTPPVTTAPPTTTATPTTTASPTTTVAPSTTTSSPTTTSTALPPPPPPPPGP